jgi:two-component system, response regulator PdtaR
MIGALQHSSALARGRTMDGAKGSSQSRSEGQAFRTILLVEDEVLVRMMIASELRDAGFTVIETATPRQALDVLTHEFDVKLLLSDIQMPGNMDGLALARVVRSAYPAIKIVLTSGRNATGEATKYDAFVPKPCDPPTMIGHIKALLG